MTMNRFAIAAAVTCIASMVCAADQPPLLNLDNGASGSLFLGGSSSLAQDVRLDAEQRGVTAGGASRVASPFGWVLNADLAAVDELATRSLGPIDLVTGAVTYSDSQLVLPAVAHWPIGISYTSGRSASHISGGLQGNNWFQDSQPSITEPDTQGIVRLFYAANAFVEFKRVNESDYFVGVNGAGGVLHRETATSGEGIELQSAQVYRLLDQVGNEIVFFGFGAETTAISAAAGQLWKYSVGAGTGMTAATAYAGHHEKPLTAAATGYSGGRLVLARDSAGRTFNYAYTPSVGGFDRLTSVTVQTPGSSPTTIATVQYAYYGDSTIANTNTNNGSNGDLALVRITLPTSFGASGSSAAIEDIRENRFYYASGSRLKLVLGYEGTRRHLVDAGSSLVSWSADATTLATALNSFAEARFAYPSGGGVKVESAWFGGMDGNDGRPLGQYDLSFEATPCTTSPAWKSRAVVKSPSFTRYAGSSLNSPGEASGSIWTTQYFDALGQPLHSVASAVDPSTLGANATNVWISGVVRDANYRLTALQSPAACTSYNHNASGCSRGTYSTTTSGIVTTFERATTGDAYIGRVEGVRRGSGGSSDPYVSWNVLFTQDVELSASPKVELRRPILQGQRTYPTATTNPSTSGTFNYTSFAHTFWDSGTPDTVIVRTLTTNLPAVSTTHNGTGIATSRKTWFDHFGRPIVSRLPNGRLDTSEYASTTGLLERRVTDAPSPSSTAFPDLPSGDMPTAADIGGEAASTAYNLTTTYAYDALGRTELTTKNAEANSGNGRTAHISRSYYTRLSDRRIVRMDVPTVDTSTTHPTYYGPISASVVNHIGLVEESGLISPANPIVLPTGNPSAFKTTSVPRTWLEEPSSTLATQTHTLAEAQADNTAAGSPKLVTLSTQVVSPDGSRILEGRRYTTIPTAAGTNNWAGDSGTNYDNTQASYNGLGIADRTVDFTGTIDRYRFDLLGRTVRHERGTNDETMTGTDNMRPRSSLVFDATTYGSSTGTNLNIFGGDGRTTQLFQHPSGTYGALNDVHTNIRYDTLGNPVNVWGDEGPFLAATVDNLGRPVTTSAFDGVLGHWNSTPVTPGPGSGTIGYRVRHAETFRDELGRVYEQIDHAVYPYHGTSSPTPGDLIATPGDAVHTQMFYGRNGNENTRVGMSTQMVSRDRVCRVKAEHTLVAVDSSTSNNADFTSGNPANQIVLAQTNYFVDANRRHTVATVSAERGTPDVESTGAVSSAGPPSVTGALMSYPGGSGWWGVSHNPTGGLLLLPEPTFDKSWLKTNVRTTSYDGLLLYPTKSYEFGDVLRHTSPPEQICLGLGCTDPFADPSGAWPYIETETQIDPRYIWCKSTTTDWESGERTFRAQHVNAAGQLIESMSVSRRVLPQSVGLPELEGERNPLVPTDGCCDRAERVRFQWSKGRLRLQQIANCNPPMSDASFNPLDITNFESWCGGVCSKDSSFGYPDLLPVEDMFPPDFTTTVPNDNNRMLWAIRPTGASPASGTPTPDDDGYDDTDWFVYDDLGRVIKKYANQYRKPDFADGAASTAPFDQIFWSRAGRPTEVRKPSGISGSPIDATRIAYDALGRPKNVDHTLGSTSLGSSWSPTDQILFRYDRFGMLSEYRQSFDGMFSSGCAPSEPDKWIICGLEREGTPQQSIHLSGTSGSTLRPWQGPRLVKQLLPAGKIMGLSYMPNPSGSGETDWFDAGVAGPGGLLMEPKFDWVTGRTRGIWSGTSTNPFDLPVSQYDYLGVNTPLRRNLPGVGIEKWMGLLPEYKPYNGGAGGGSGTAAPHKAPDWRWRYRDDLFNPVIDAMPTDYPPSLFHNVEGHKDIIWVGMKISSFKDPKTTPDFGVDSGGMPLPSPVDDFPIHGHDELFRYDCNGKPLYWASGQMPAMLVGATSTKPFEQLDGAYNVGRAKAAQNPLTTAGGAGAGAAAAGFTGISAIEMRWPEVPGDCNATGGGGGWLIAPDGEINLDHPLAPRSPGPLTEWQNNEPSALDRLEGSDCGQSPNSRTGTAHRFLTPTGGGSPGEVGGWPRSHAYDAAGNLKSDGRFFYQYDGSNRLTKVSRLVVGTSGLPITPAPDSTYAEFGYDPMGRLLKSRYDVDGNGDLSNNETEWTPRDLLGRPLGIWRQRPPSTEEPAPCARPYQLFGYHSTGFRGTGFDQSGGVLDSPAMRWRDTDNDGGLDEELYYLQDFRGDVTGLALDHKSGVVERVRYGLTGRPETFPPADIDFDGDVDTDDADAFDKALNAFIDDPADYDPRADLDHDGVIDYDDESSFLESHGLNNGLEGNWKLSQGAGVYKVDDPADGLDNRFGWRGYWYDPKLELYHVRHRVFDPRSGRWMQVDPLGFAAGDQDLYRYCGGNFSTGYDPTGLIDGYSQAVTFDPQTGEGLCSQEFMFGRPIGPGEAVNGRNSSGDALDQAANFAAGWADALSFGGTDWYREQFGLNDTVDYNSGAYGAGAITGSVHMAVMAGGVGGNLAVANWGLRAGSTGAAILGGAAGGMVGDYAFQHSMIATGMQGEYNPTQTLAMGALGGYLGYAFHGIAGLLSAPTASVDMVAARAALAADGVAAAGRGAAGGGGAAAGACNGAGTAAATTGRPSLLNRYLSESGGRWGNGETRALNDRLASALEGEGFTITGGAGRAPEEWIPGIGGGSRGGTFVDITARRGMEVVRVQSVTTIGSGLPTPAELAAAARIRAAFPDHGLWLIPKP